MIQSQNSLFWVGLIVMRHIKELSHSWLSLFGLRIIELNRFKWNCWKIRKERKERFCMGFRELGIGVLWKLSNIWFRINNYEFMYYQILKNNWSYYIQIWSSLIENNKNHTYHLNPYNIIYWSFLYVIFY